MKDQSARTKHESVMHCEHVSGHSCVFTNEHGHGQTDSIRDILLRRTCIVQY